mmetsp:Transcript_46394/g.97506  ORF Transcript_46394/g.97506 Transcript_46394/m.97506 type:complete len:287 (+) Transcript_46394:1032-1892(+)
MRPELVRRGAQPRHEQGETQIRPRGGVPRERGGGIGLRGRVGGLSRIPRCRTLGAVARSQSPTALSARKRGGCHPPETDAIARRILRVRGHRQSLPRISPQQLLPHHRRMGQQRRAPLNEIGKGHGGRVAGRAGGTRSHSRHVRRHVGHGKGGDAIVRSEQTNGGGGAVPDGHIAGEISQSSIVQVQVKDGESTIVLPRRGGVFRREPTVDGVAHAHGIFVHGAMLGQAAVELAETSVILLVGNGIGRYDNSKVRIGQSHASIVQKDGRGVGGPRRRGTVRECQLH